MDLLAYLLTLIIFTRVSAEVKYFNSSKTIYVSHFKT